MRQNESFVLGVRLWWSLLLRRLLRLSLLSRCCLLYCRLFCCCLLLRLYGLLNHDFVLEQDLRMLRGRDRVGAAEQKLTAQGQHTNNKHATHNAAW